MAGDLHVHALTPASVELLFRASIIVLAYQLAIYEMTCMH